MPFTIVRDDITHLKADAIVNAANEQLRQGGGVCGAIFAAAGARRLQAACNKIGHCDTGSAVATRAFRLRARYIIHAVGPIWRGGSHGERALLARCYRSSLELAASLKCKSIAFPLISAGIYGYPPSEALEVAQAEVRAFLDAHDMDITLVLYNAGVMHIADDLRLKVARYIDDTYVGEHQALSQRQAWEREQFLSLDMPFPAAAAPMEAEDTGTLPAPGAVQAEHCPICGSPIQPHAPYCTHCGTKLDGAAFAEAYPDGGPATADAPYEASVSYDAAYPPDGLLVDEDVHYDSFAAAPMPSAAPSFGSAAHERASAPATSAAKPRHSLPSFELPSSLAKLLTNLDAGFSDTLMAMIDARGLKDSEVYKRANMSRQHFSKIRSNPRYQPNKTTVLALAVALKLSLEETELLLERAGFALSHADVRDIIVEYFINEGIYDVFTINDALFCYDQKLLA